MCWENAFRSSSFSHGGTPLNPEASAESMRVSLVWEIGVLALETLINVSGMKSASATPYLSATESCRMSSRMNARMNPGGLLPAILLAGLLLSGCTGNSSVASPSDSPTASPLGDPPVAPQIVRIPIFMPISAGNQSGPLPFIVNGPPPISDGGPIPVAENATAMLVEVRWSCSSPTCRFQFELEDPNDQNVVVMSSSGPIRFQVPSEIPVIPGKWDVVVRPDSANVKVQGEFRVSAFYGGPVPDGYTAF